MRFYATKFIKKQLRQKALGIRKEKSNNPTIRNKTVIVFIYIAWIILDEISFNMFSIHILLCIHNKIVATFKMFVIYKGIFIHLNNQIYFQV